MAFYKAGITKLLGVKCTKESAALPLPAAPVYHWYKDKTNYFIIGLYVGSSIYRTKEISSCRARNDIQHCPDGGYGPFRGRETLAWGTGLTMAALTIYGRAHWRNGWKNELINDSPVLLWSGYNFKVGLSDHNVATFPKKDLSNIHITR